jgi:hypothetical protein
MGAYHCKTPKREREFRQSIEKGRWNLRASVRKASAEYECKMKMSAQLIRLTCYKSFIPRKVKDSSLRFVYVSSRSKEGEINKWSAVPLVSNGEDRIGVVKLPEAARWSCFTLLRLEYDEEKWKRSFGFFMLVGRLTLGLIREGAR